MTNTFCLHAKKAYCLLFLTLLFIVTVSAQGDGPRSAQLAPTGVFGIASKYVNLSTNISPATVLVKEADFEIQLFPVSAFYTFKIKNQFAQVIGVITPAQAKLKLTGTAPGIPSSLKANGIADGFIGLKLGMVGAPGLGLQDFAQRSPTFSMFSFLRFWYTGNYEAQEVLNLGSNRFTIQYSIPMAIPLNQNRERMTWLEITPGVRIFTPNNEPQLLIQKNKTQQKPLFQLETHLSHNFTKKIWMAANLHYQLGGRTILDGVDQDNQINMLGAAVSAGYKLLPYLSASVDYGRRVYGDNGVNSRMIRAGLVFTYLKTNNKKGS